MFRNKLNNIYLLCYVLDEYKILTHEIKLYITFSYKPKDQILSI